MSGATMCACCGLVTSFAGECRNCGFAVFVHTVAVPAKPAPAETAPTKPAPSEAAIRRECDKLADFLVEKNRAYGDSVFDPLRIVSSASPSEGVQVRMDDKLSRLIRGEPGQEDTLLDFVGYWVILQALKEKEASGDDDQ